MDLFRKDQKNNNLSSPVPPSGSTETSVFKNLKNKLTSSSGSFSISSRLREALLRLASFLSVAVLTLVLLLWGGLFFYKNSLTGQIKDLKRQQAEVFSVKDKEMAVKIVNFDKGATLMQTLLKNHIYSSIIFDRLASATLPRVQWRSFDLLAPDSKLTLKGFSADYATLAKQMLALAEDNFSNLAVSNISLDKTGGVGFMISFNFSPKILQK